ncbi:uncharacterized protein LOC120501777 [Passer montanus]|uniref:uncharacterized protein LOC120501777 n=1 Tax=Passer montanus TaxID=9160 RepID=UPI00195FA793|nr:uncharacterized protein LOC120501777 [Passer montanus]
MREFCGEQVGSAARPHWPAGRDVSAIRVMRRWRHILAAGKTTGKQHQTEPPGKQQETLSQEQSASQKQNRAFRVTAARCPQARVTSFRAAASGWGSHPRPPRDVTGIAGRSFPVYCSLCSGVSPNRCSRRDSPGLGGAAGSRAWVRAQLSPPGHRRAGPELPGPAAQAAVFHFHPCRTPRCWARMAPVPTVPAQPRAFPCQGAISSNSGASPAKSLAGFSKVTNQAVGQLVHLRSHFPKAKAGFLQGALKNLRVLLPEIIPEQERMWGSAAVISWWPH